MHINVLKAKIHRATVTDADLHYDGSITIGSELLATAGLLPYEKVEIYNITNGERFATYAIPGPEGSICLNGAAAWKAKVGDRVIIAAYCQIPEEQVSEFKPTIVQMADQNKIFKVSRATLLLN